MIHTEYKDGDKYEIIIDGIWSRFTNDREEAIKYAVKNGNSVVQDIETGRIVERIK